MAYAGEPGSLAPGAARCNRSRTMSDFETPRRRDSASIAAAIASGRRTVNVFTGLLYYMPAIDEIHAFNGTRPPRASPCKAVVGGRRSRALPWLMLSVVPMLVLVLAFNFFRDGLRDAADP